MGFSPLSMFMNAWISVVLSCVLALMAMAFYTLMERKFLGYFQTRKGPNKPSLIGLPVPFADAIKLFTKEQSTPTLSNKYLFHGAPVLGLVLALLMWVLYSHTNQSFFITFGALYFLCVSSMNVYSTFLAGWCSNSKYALLGSLRGVAQTISYEVSMTLILISALIMSSTMDFTMMTMNQHSFTVLMLPLITIMWFITNLAETNRTPFDFAEGESELVSGFNVEYSSGVFALIFMAEYTSILAMSMITASIMFGNSTTMLFNNLMLITQTLLISILYIWVRATMPRMRYDHLMYLTWKSFLPVSIGVLMYY
uniref:NADH-ubiquinone oxidoreductase chain 1 n=1 Tax=Limnodrilus hoffmeisteri TaxID=76587 RepID=A0A8F2F9V1_9ANNE|nr:NADH dehydrogenase subunit 1 [Limnodrilus hoffmeisteri]